LKHTIISPGAVIGVLGSGQLGRMLALAARRMGYRVHTLSPDADSPTGQVADAEVIAPYDDLQAIERFARGVDVVTFEFENVPSPSAEAAAKHAPVRPHGSVLHVTQHRQREKTWLRTAGIPVARFEVVESPDQLGPAVQRIGTPAILKTSGFGYDGKGQARIDRPEDSADAWRQIGGGPAVLEGFVEFEREISVVLARGLDGQVAAWAPLENEHRHHILDVTVAPARVDMKVQKRAVELARTVIATLDAVGVICVEMFLRSDGDLLVNEIAPRTHNSGHLTIEAALTSQFEQQVRAICGLPLGATDLVAPAAMANLLGDLWSAGEPQWDRALRLPEVKLHLYGKAQARPGRKMGHLTALGPTPDSAMKRVMTAREALVAGTPAVAALSMTS